MHGNTIFISPQIILTFQNDTLTYFHVNGNKINHIVSYTKEGLIS